ncbi:phage antirepressor N-terminal domain-containing protein [Runella limosa]|uniref:phage antirepressor N-terminal domain-containing protein n=1 Tax=Runella limosa TaxID=370978 RepID=UPI0004186D73|nr:phage antirepressor N-terminal domain-containing protein [Runella limosa]
MKKLVLKSILVLNRPVYYLVDNGVNYVLIRPLCEALQIDADWQIRELKKDEDLAAEVCEHTTQLPSDKQKRAFTCLPEEFIYGWIFSIKYSNTMSEETRENLRQYKRECYDALYSHFHAKVRSLTESIKERAELEVEARRLKMRLLENPEFVRWQEINTLKQQQSYRLTKDQKESLMILVEEMMEEESVNN